MATSSYPISVNATNLPDGSTNNLAPQYSRRKGSLASSNGDQFLMTLDFDNAQREQVWAQFIVPANYASAPVLVIHWGANATTNSVVWGCRVGALTPGDADTPYNHAMATAQTATTAVPGTTARKVAVTSITISNADSMAAGDLLIMQIYRDGANGSDTCTVDAEALAFDFQYVTT